MPFSLLNVVSQQKIVLDRAEFVIGRDSILQVTDKRIARQHGVLKVKSSYILLVSTHDNPIYYKKQNVNDNRINCINKDEDVMLDDGDSFALFPDDFWFKILLNKIEDDYMQNFGACNEQPQFIRMHVRDVETINNLDNIVRHDNNVHIENDNGTKHSNNPQICIIEENQTNISSQRKRILPSWMNNSGDASTSIISISPKKKISNNVDTSLNNQGDNLTQTTLTNINDNINKTQIPLTNNNQQIASSTLANSILHVGNNVKLEVSDSNEAESVAITSNNNTGDCASTSRFNNTTDDQKLCVKKEEADSNTHSRDSCQFGIRCYRRNPVHRSEMAHPGDVDYRRPNYPPAPSTAPLCPYGDRCYRRNPIHFQQYSHPSSTDFKKNRKRYLIQKQKRHQIGSDTDSQNDDANEQLPNKRKRNTINYHTKEDYSDDENDYDYDDPFIDDNTSDEYVPSSETEDDYELDADFDTQNLNNSQSH